VLHDPFRTDEPTAETQDFYRDAHLILNRSSIPFLLGGAYALAFYTGIKRFTKDLDIFVRAQDCARILEIFAAAGYRVEQAFPHWLGKVFCGDNFIDVIFSSGNGVVKVDDEWFAHAVAAEFWNLPTKICPCEELIWNKAYVMERERFDGADVAHLFLARADSLDWSRLLQRFGPHWEILLTHLVLFGFIYPGDRTRIPNWVLRELTGKLLEADKSPAPIPNLCQGTLLSREQYLIDIELWRKIDARLVPIGNLKQNEIATWTEAIKKN
jgi:hypothetical protein